MNILMTSDSYLPLIGGAEYHIFYLQQELIKQGCNVELFVTYSGTNKPDDSVVSHEYTSIWSILPIFKKIWVHSKKADIIHSHYSYRLSCIAATVAFLRRKPFVITQHGMGLLPQAQATFLQNIVFTVWRFWSQKVAKIIISTSDDLSLEIKKLGFGAKIISIPNGYDAHTFTELPAPNNATIELLTVRRLVPKNGIQFVIAALPALRLHYPTIHLTCVGDGRLKDIIETMAHELQVEDCISFVGTKSHAEIMEYYAKANVVLIPSTAESTSLACIEAMALGKIIVASRVGGLVELLGENSDRGYLVNLLDDEHSNYDAPLTLPAHKINLLVQTIIEALTNEHDAAQKTQAAMLYASQKFSWHTIAKKTLNEVYSVIYT